MFNYWQTKEQEMQNMIIMRDKFTQDFEELKKQREKMQMEIPQLNQRMLKLEVKKLKTNLKSIKVQLETEILEQIAKTKHNHLLLLLMLNDQTSRNGPNVKQFTYYFALIFAFMYLKL